MAAFSFKDTAGDIPVPVAQEFKQLTSSMNQYVAKEHNVDGTHSAVTADHVKIGGNLVGEWVELTVDQSRLDDDTGTVTWTLNANDSNLIQYCLVGNLAIIQFYIDGTLSSSDGDKASALYIKIPEINVQRYRVSTGRIIIFNSIGAGNNNTDGHFPFDTLAYYGSTGSSCVLSLERFNSIERGGASTTYGNWRNESTIVYGQICVRTTENNEFRQFKPQ